MAKLKLKLKDKSDNDLLAFAQQHIAAITGNAAFATPTPPPTAFLAAVTAFQTALAASVAAQQSSKEATTVKDDAREVLEGVLTQRGSYVESVAPGETAKFQSVGFDAKAGRSPVGVPNQVMNLFITAGDESGELDLQWDPLSNARSYEVQLSPDPVTSTGWVNKPSGTKSKTAITGLTSGTRMWARVRAVAAAGPGAWSDPATKFVP